jgi:NAD(P)H-hydrate epimerase
LKPVFSFDEIREVEKRIIQNDSVPSLILMENAGTNAFIQILNEFRDIDEYEIFIITGKGNNAGDGFVIARQMTIENLPVTVVMLSNEAELKGDALVNFELLKKVNNPDVEIIPFDRFIGRRINRGKILLIDAILGSGIKGKLNEEFEGAINNINKLKEKNKKLKIASVDVPSGLMSGQQVNSVVNADMTVTMGTVKTEMLYGKGKDNSGDVYAVPIGISFSYLNRYNDFKKYVSELSDVKELFPRRKKSSYKYSNGKALVIGGSSGLSGAAIMSSASALKAGAGAVVSAIPKSVSSHFSRKLFDVVKIELEDNEEGSISGNAYNSIAKRIDSSDAVLLGPGISLNEDTKTFVFDVIRKCSKNLVVDADALTIIAEHPNVLLNRENESEVILTPHIGEFARLSGVDSKDIILNRFAAVRDFAAKYNVNVVMKSETTFSCLKNGDIYINLTGNEALGVVGSGDVLSGILVSLLAQTRDVYRAVICGTYLHGLCADLYFKKHGNKQSASQQDLIKLIPKAITHILND